MCATRTSRTGSRVPMDGRCFRPRSSGASSVPVVSTPWGRSTRRCCTSSGSVPSLQSSHGCYIDTLDTHSGNWSTGHSSSWERITSLQVCLPLFLPSRTPQLRRIQKATGINYSSWAIVNFTFNHYIKHRFFAWWTKYNYVLAAALDTGLALSGLVIFLCITYPGAVFPDWWGNNVYLNTADGQGLPWKGMPEVGYFGPGNGTWS